MGFFATKAGRRTLDIVGLVLLAIVVTVGVQWALN